MNKEEFKIYWKNYVKTDKGKKVLYTAIKKQRDKTRLKLLGILGGKCVHCGFSDFRALQFDHINSDGPASKKRFRTTTVMIYYYLKHIEEARLTLQVLCANCNWIKRYELKENTKSFHIN